MADLYGSDIEIDGSGRPVVAANGELAMVEGVATGVQDIRLRLGTPLGELFYDTEFGSLLHEWILEENTIAARTAFEAEVAQRIEADPRVVLDSVSCRVVSWNETGLTATATWEFIDEDHPFNLVVSWDSSKKEMVIEDVNPRSGL